MCIHQKDPVLKKDVTLETALLEVCDAHNFLKRVQQMWNCQCLGFEGRFIKQTFDISRHKSRHVLPRKVWRASALSSIIPKLCWYCGIPAMFGYQAFWVTHVKLQQVSTPISRWSQAQRLWCVFEMAAFAWAHRLGCCAMMWCETTASLFTQERPQEPSWDSSGDFCSSALASNVWE